MASPISKKGRILIRPFLWVHSLSSLFKKYYGNTKKYINTLFLLTYRGNPRLIKIFHSELSE
jgi:hypothetical protein